MNLMRFLAILAIVVSVRAVHAQGTGNAWVRQRVVTKEQSPLMVGTMVVDNGARHRIYTVEKTNGDNLWLVAPGTPSGWMHNSKVIPFDDAIAYFADEIRKNPGSAPLYIRLSAVWNDKGEYGKAIDSLNEAIRLDPGDSIAFNNRGWNRWSMKHYDGAIADYTEAIRLKPDSALTFGNRAAAYHAKKDYPKALADLNEAIRLDPKYAHAYSDRAWIWATCPIAKLRDGKQAVESATKACELSGWKYAEVVGTLAAAKAEVGDFANAVAWQTKANAIYHGKDAQREGYERLALYRDKQPFREKDASPQPARPR
jgi:tetratricopeptide (TPR) repeat protein